MVTNIQRFGTKLNFNLHLPVLALDAAYSFKHGKACFHRAGGHVQRHSTLCSRLSSPAHPHAGACRCAGDGRRAALLYLELDSPYGNKNFKLPFGVEGEVSSGRPIKLGNSSLAWADRVAAWTYLRRARCLKRTSYRLNGSVTNSLPGF
jgi:hypothetical protein